MIQVKVAELRPWLATQSGTGAWYVANQEGSAISQIGLTEHDAKLMAAAPQILRFLSLFLGRPNSPAFIDITNMLARAGIELEL